MSHSQSDDYDCDIPPPLGVEPLSCCRISKPFDRKNFPECFIDPIVATSPSPYPPIPVSEDFIDDGPTVPPTRGYINRGYPGYKGYNNKGQDIDTKKYKQFIVAHWPSKYHWGFDSHTPIHSKFDSHTPVRSDYRPYSSTRGNGRYRRSPIYRPIIPPIVSNLQPFKLKIQKKR